jgi:hypothetical protein
MEIEMKTWWEKLPWCWKVAIGAGLISLTIMYVNLFMSLGFWGRLLP